MVIIVKIMVLNGNSDVKKFKDSKSHKLRLKPAGTRKNRIQTEQVNHVRKDFLFVSKTDQEERRNFVSKFTTNESVAGIVPPKAALSSRRTQPNFSYQKQMSRGILNSKDAKVGDSKYESLCVLKKIQSPKSGINLVLPKRSNHFVAQNSQQQLLKARKVSAVPEQRILPVFHETRKKRLEVDIQTSCLIETIAKSCQTLRESQIDILNFTDMLHTLLDKIKKNKWGYEFTYVIFQTAAEVSKKSLIINKSKKSSMAIANVMKQIEHFDDLFQLGDQDILLDETKELIEVITWLLNSKKFHITGTVDPKEVSVIMSYLDQSKSDLLPVAIFDIRLSLESHTLQRWFALHEKTNRVIQCYMFVSPTKIYKYLRHGFSKKPKHPFVTFQNHLPFLEEETEMFLIWDITRTQKEDELIVVLVAHMVDDEECYEVDVYHDQIVYKIKDPASLLIKHILLYSRQQYQIYSNNNTQLIQQQKSNFSVPSIDFTLWLSIFFTMFLLLMITYEFFFFSIEKEEKKKEFSLISVLLDSFFDQV